MLKSTEKPLAPGTLLSDRYRVQTVLGCGGMGCVYSAHDEVLSRPVALKTLSTTLAVQPERALRFEREARAAAGVRHPGIVQVYDRGVDDGLMYVVMELLEGEDLTSRILNGPRLTPGWVAKMGRELCLAVHAAHGTGVVHRDLKPSNVFVARTADQGERIKVLDFGVAKLRTPEATGLTRSDQVFGTVAYMAPEQLESARNADVRCDVYSIGCILWHMLLGRPPFEGRSAVELSLQVLRQTPIEPRLIREDVPRLLSDAVTRAMAKKPAKRFATAADLALVLGQVAQKDERSQPVASSPPERREGDGTSPPP